MATDDYCCLIGVRGVYVSKRRFLADRTVWLMTTLQEDKR